MYKGRKFMNSMNLHLLKHSYTKEDGSSTKACSTETYFVPSMIFSAQVHT